MAVFLLAVAGTVSADSYVYTNVSNGTSSYMNTSVTSTGGSSADVHVENKVENSSTSNTATAQSVHKKIEVTVNGEKKVIESTEPGETKVEVTNGTVNVTTGKGNAPTATPAPSATPTVSVTPSLTPTMPPAQSAAREFYEKLRTEILDILKNFFK